MLQPWEWPSVNKVAIKLFRWILEKTAYKRFLSKLRYRPRDVMYTTRVIPARSSARRERGFGKKMSDQDGVI